jgi:hypothetical protein
MFFQCCCSHSSHASPCCLLPIAPHFIPYSLLQIHTLLAYIIGPNDIVRDWSRIS